ncbi:MAG: hypothetical protein ACREEB_17745 [Caulobacteraceae bacterium]
MNKRLDHLPDGRHRELEFVVGTLRAAFAEAQSQRSSPRLRNGRLLKIVLFGSWPTDTKFQKRCYELIRAANVKARFSRHYRITAEELAWLETRITSLRAMVQDLCERWLAELRGAAA